MTSSYHYLLNGIKIHHVVYYHEYILYGPMLGYDTTRTVNSPSLCKLMLASAVLRFEGFVDFIFFEFSSLFYNFKLTLTCLR